MGRAILFSVLFVIIAASVVIFVYSDKSVIPYVPTESYLSTIRVGNAAIKVEIADTPVEYVRGLAGRETLAPNHGMLFVFEEDGAYKVWGKDMKFSVDVLWISRDGVVVHIQGNVTPASYPKTYASEVPARYVLQVPGDFTEIHNIEVGEIIDLSHI